MLHAPQRLKRRVWDSNKACQWAYSPFGQTCLKGNGFTPIRYIEFSSMRHQGFRALSRCAAECEYCGVDGGEDSAR